jgi:hypothetical protein
LQRKENRNEKSLYSVFMKYRFLIGIVFTLACTSSWAQATKEKPRKPRPTAIAPT